jgi:hypothetical protein
MLDALRSNCPVPLRTIPLLTVVPPVHRDTGLISLPLTADAAVVLWFCA